MQETDSLKLTILYLSRSLVAELGAEDMNAALAEVEEVFSLKEKGDAIVPDKVSMGFGKTISEEKRYGRINAMPGFLGGHYQMAGMKWVGSNPGNLDKGLPRASAVTILNDPVTKFPVAIMDGTAISAVRTGAGSGVAMKYLAKKTSRTLVLIGAGLQAATQLEAALCVYPGLQEIYITDSVRERAEAFAMQMQGKFGRAVTPVENAREYGRRADILITATGAAQPVIDAGWLNPNGCLYINLGGYECGYELVKRADKRVVDSWRHVKHRNAGTIARMANEGLLSDEEVYADLGQIVNGTLVGRTSGKEIIYYNGVGMGVQDIAIASRIYRLAMEQGKGIRLPYWD